MEPLHLGRVAGDLRQEQIVAQFGTIPGLLEDARRSRQRNSGTLHFERSDRRRRGNKIALNIRAAGVRSAASATDCKRDSA